LFLFFSFLSLGCFPIRGVRRLIFFSSCHPKTHGNRADVAISPCPLAASLRSPFPPRLLLCVTFFDCPGRSAMRAEVLARGSSLEPFRIPPGGVTSWCHFRGELPFCSPFSRIHPNPRPFPTCCLHVRKSFGRFGASLSPLLCLFMSLSCTRAFSTPLSCFLLLFSIGDLASFQPFFPGPFV